MAAGFLTNVEPETIVVTGASSGIGRELAIQLAGKGRKIWLVGRNTVRLECVAEMVRQKGAEAIVVKLDISDLEESSRFLEKEFPETLRIDEVYLAAAVTQFGEIKDTLIEDWERIYHTNLLSPIQWALHYYKNMISLRKGRIVIISSLAAYSGYPTAAAYATMKRGLLGLFKSLVHEGEIHNVSFHIASPGYVDTGIYRSAIFRGTSYEKTMRLIEGLGFPVMPAEKASEIILQSIRRGKNEFAFPGYAAMMKWMSPRMPFLIGLIHSRIVNRFRQA